MKKILSLLMLSLLAVGAWAADETVDFSQQGYENAQEVTSYNGTNFTVTFNKGTNSNTPKYYTTGKAIRVYGGSYFTVTSAKTITQIVLSFGSGDGTNEITTNVGTYDSGSWTGSASSVQFTIGGTTGHRRIASIAVTFEGGQTTLAAPTFDPAGGTYYSAQNVVISGPEGATIYYTTDGNDPTTASSVYSAPIAVNQTTTIKAIASNGQLTSSVASATYTIASMSNVDNIAAYAALEDNAFATFNNPVNVTYASGKSVYVKDATGFMCIYGDEVIGKYHNGDVIPAGFAGKKTIYNTGLEMASPLTGFVTATSTATVDPEEITFDNFSSQPMWKYVIIKDAMISEVNNKNVTLTNADGSATIAGFNQFSVAVPSNHSIPYDVIGIITSHSGNPELYLVDFVNNAPAPTVDNIAAYAALDDNTVAVFNNPVNVTYANGKNVYVKDATGYMCIFGDEVIGKYNNGDVIPAGFAGKKTIYNTGLEMASPLTGFVDATSTTTVEPEEITFANFSSQPMWKYVIIKDAIISNVSNKNVTLTNADGTATIAGYNQYGITIPNDHSIAYDVIGIVTSYNNNLQLYLVEVVDDTPLSTYVDDIDGLLALEQGKNAIFSNPVTAVYHSGNQLYIKDGNDDFMLVYGHLNNTYNNGDVLTGIAGGWTIYNGMTEMIPLADYFTEATAGTPVEPETLAIEEISQDLIHHYLRIENCTITAIEGDTRNFTLADETGEMVMRLNFTEVSIAEDFDFTAEYNVEGFLAYYKKSDGTVEQLQFYPNLIQKVGGTVVVPGDVNGDGVVTTADVTALYQVILNGNYSAIVNGDQTGDGVITTADVTAVYKVILGL